MSQILLSQVSTRPPLEVDRDRLEKETKNLIDELGDLQEILFAQAKHSILIIFQGMDASGKDGAVRKVFEECHPKGLKVISFKKPTDLELAHDFLWRVHQHTPPRGMIHIFNRSHYEDVLIQRVHRWIDEDQVDQRFASINAFERLLQHDAQTTIVKFFLHISYEQQEKELQERLDERNKHYKHNPGDWRERKHWDTYMRCYEDVLVRSEIPWTIVPVDKRWYRDYIVARTLVDTLKKLDLEWPRLSDDDL